MSVAASRSRFASLRWKLTLSYLLLLLGLVGAFGVYQYISLHQALITARVNALQDDVDVARGLLNRSAITQQRLRALCTSDSRQGAQTIASAVATASGHTVSVVFFSSAGDVLAQAPPGGSLPEISATGLATAQAGERSAPEVVSFNGEDHLLVAFPIAPTISRSCGALELVSSLSGEESVLNREILLLTVGGIAALILGLIAGLFITGRALQPLQRLRQVAGQLAQGNLAARSQLAPRSDEIGELTQAFDEMAQGIEGAFAVQKESEQQTRRFIADASHELRTPVTALKGYIDVMQRGAARDPEALSHALGAMAKEAERMRVLVLDLLTLARLDNHRPLQIETVDLTDVISQVLDEAAPNLADQDRLHRNFAAAPVIAKADAAAVSTIVRNLFVNACKYAPGANQYWSTSYGSNCANFEIRDDGPGIAAEDIPHLFERFYRGAKNRAREDGGSGLGLSIVDGLVKAQGGSINVSSIEGQGTTFRVSLPAAI